MKKTITALMLALILTLLPISTIFAQDDVDQILLDIEDERTVKLEQQLVLSIPHITDNPNHIVSFTDPSPDQDGIKLEIDGQGFVSISNPYNLPALGIGKHILTFRFTDNENTTQNLEKEIIVIPRPAIINAPDVIGADQMTFTGTALAGSTVQLFLTGGILNETAIVEVENSGEWLYSFTENYETAIYTIVAVTTKNGYASSYSEPIVFELKNGGTVINTGETSTINFSFKSFFQGDILNNAKENIDLLWYGLATLILGLGIGILTMKLTTKKQSKDVQKIFADSVASTPVEQEKKEEGDTKNMSLREKFEKAGYKTTKEETKPLEKKTKEKEKTIEELVEDAKKAERENSEDKEESKKEEKSTNDKKEPKEEEKKSKKKVMEEVEEDLTEQIGKEIEKEEKPKNKSSKSVSKEEFLKEFKDQDPDDEKGEEKKSTKKAKAKKKKDDKMTKNIKIDLTSKK